MTVGASPPSRWVDVLFGAAIGLAIAGAVFVAALNAVRQARAKLDDCITEACSVCRGGR